MLKAFIKRISLISIVLFCVNHSMALGEHEEEPIVKLIEVASRFSKPVQVTNAGDGGNRLFVLEQSGIIKIIKADRALKKPFLDIRDKVVLDGTETGLLGLAFHPDFASNGRLFVNYTMVDGFGDNDSDDNNSDDSGDNNEAIKISSEEIKGLKTIIAEYRVSDDDPDRADISERVILAVDQPTNIHNGGQLLFGPDGYLYIGVGDGGPANDGSGNGQDKDTLLGAILRIDVDGAAPYSIPLDNPFVGVDGADEIFAYGFRNPWKFSFDSLSGRLFAGDVGQRAREEIDLVEPGGNYGWSVKEGNKCFSKSVFECDETGLTPPIAEYTHEEGVAIIGGHVYRGSELPGLEGLYIFGDFAFGAIWTLAENALDEWRRDTLLQTGFQISSFGEDEQGELYVLDYSNGIVFKIVDPLTPEPTPDPEPKLPVEFNVDCNRVLIEGVGRRKKLFIDLGETAFCELSIANLEYELPVSIEKRIKSFPEQNIIIKPDTVVINEAGKFQFTINAVKEGLNWISWALPDKAGEFQLNNRAGANEFVEVKYN